MSGVCVCVCALPNRDGTRAREVFLKNSNVGTSQFTYFLRLVTNMPRIISSSSSGSKPQSSLAVTNRPTTVVSAEQRLADIRQYIDDHLTGHHELCIAQQVLWLIEPTEKGKRGGGQSQAQIRDYLYNQDLANSDSMEDFIVNSKAELRNLIEHEVFRAVEKLKKDKIVRCNNIHSTATLVSLTPYGAQVLAEMRKGSI